MPIVAITSPQSARRSGRGSGRSWRVGGAADNARGGCAAAGSGGTMHDHDHDHLPIRYEGGPLDGQDDALCVLHELPDGEPPGLINYCREVEGEKLEQGPLVVQYRKTGDRTAGGAWIYAYNGP